MNKIFTLIFFIGSLLSAESVYTQGSCATAVTVTDLTGATCATATPSGADNINTGCGNGTLDTWFVFTAQGPSATISVSNPGTNNRWNPEFAVISSSDNTCSGVLTLEGCADQTSNYVTIVGTINGLIPGDTYWIVVTSNGNQTSGTITTCVTNAAATPCQDNDDCLTALTITLNATGSGASCITDCNNSAALGPDFSGFGLNCFDLPNETVWYEFTTDASASTIDINLTSATLTQPEFSLFTTTDCFNFLVEDCTEGSGGTASATVNISPNTTYILAVSDVGGLEGNFDLCIIQNAAISSCVDNEDCSGAATLTLNPSGAGASCVTDCNTGASAGPDFAGNNCYDLPNETVWYQITTAADVEFLNIELNSTDMSDPEFTVFTNACGPFSIVDCVEGTGGSAQASVFVNANTTYLIAVSDATGDEGTFDLCVSQFANTAPCNTDNELAVTATSLGSPLTGPFQPGEVVTFCYTINNFSASTTNCNWLQGIVPTFGNCWTPTSFNAQGMPTVTTPLTTIGIIQDNGDCGGNPFDDPLWCPCVGASAGSWAWYPAGSVDYNLANPNPLGLTTGDDVGAGWFFTTSYSSITGVCGAGGNDPDNSYGDNDFPFCADQGGWQVCFQLTANSLIDCQAGLSDCSVQVKTFADGEIGVWGDIGCLADLPTIFNGTLNCQILLQQGLEKIKGFADNGKNFIEWEISTEANNLLSKYIVERSKDGINWYHLKDVDAVENMSLYKITDFNPFKNVTYYRVKMLEANGTEYLTQTIAVTGNLNTGDGLVSEAFPNPASNEISMLYTGESISDPLNIQIHNPMGQLIDEQIISISNVNEKITINTDKLGDGVYYVSITQNNARTVKKISVAK